MFEALIILITGLNHQKVVKYVVKQKFISYQSCEEYVKSRTSYDNDNAYYHIDNEKVKVYIHYCNKLKEKQWAK